VSDVALTGHVGRLCDPQFFNNVTRLTHHLPSPGQHSIQAIHRNSGADMLAGLHGSKARAYADGFTVRAGRLRLFRLTRIRTEGESGLANISAVPQGISASGSNQRRLSADLRRFAEALCKPLGAGVALG
jgi:hypothetical protein